VVVTERIIVVGGGIAGSSAAYQLARRGAAVTLVDRGDPGHATAAGAGIVAPGSLSSPPASWSALGVKAVAFYPELVAALTDDGMADAGYEVTGALLIATDDAERQQLADRYRLAGQPGPGEALGAVRMLDEASVRGLFPPLATGITALHMPGVGHVNGRTLRDALQRATVRRGGRMVRASATVTVEGARAAGVHVDGKLIEADAVILATGAWDDAWAGRLTAPVPLEPQRGQILHLDLIEADTSAWPVVVSFGDPYLLSFPAHRVVAGATWEDGTGFDYRVTAGGQAQLLATALGWAPGLAGATVTETRVGFRPFTPDRQPVIGPAPGWENVWFATGFGASGLTLGPYAGLVVAGLATGTPPSPDLGPYDPARFAAASFSRPGSGRPPDAGRGRPGR
jgi:D-amino-acid dehydrogenase